MHATNTSASVALNNATFSYGPIDVLTNVNLTLTKESRLGVVGRNGSGKSTLLKLLDGAIAPTSGARECAPQTANIGLLAQLHSRSDESVDDYLARRVGISDAELAFETAARNLESDTSDAAMEAYDVALQRLINLDTANFVSRVDQAMGDFRISTRVRNSTIRGLSGGELAKINLIAIIVSRSDLLLLDEPTNDLDFKGIEQLEQFVLETNAGVAVISHDRAFLRRVTNSIAEVDPHLHTVTLFRGGYESFLHEREVAHAHATERYEDNQRKRGDLAARSQQLHEWADRGVSRAKKSGETDKFIRHHNVSMGEKQAAKAKAAERAMQRLEHVDKPFEAWKLQLEFGETERSGDLVFEIRDATFARGDFTLGPISQTIHFDERVAIVGPNGSGKSTLISALLEGHAPVTGTVRRGSGVVIGTLDQGRTLFSTDKNLLDTFIDNTGLTNTEARKLLAKFDLDAELIAHACDQLSAGDQTRATLALLMANKTNCLILDEPTNHLDVEATEQLESALDAFTGTVIVVSHDRDFLQAVNLNREIELG